MNRHLTRRRFGQALLGASASVMLRPAFAQSGLEWRKLATEPFRGKQDDISFVDSRTGWYGNGLGKLYRTADGGDSWSMVWEKPGTFIRALGFVDDQIGYLGNVGTGYYPNVSDTHPLYRTQDGGVSWQPVQAEGLDTVPGICGIDIQPVDRIYQGTLQRHHIIHAAGRVGGPAMVLRSVDDGDSWSVLDLNSQAGMILDIKFHDAMLGFVCTSTSSNVALGEAQILRTEDGGKSWQPVYRSGRPFENCWKMHWPSKTVGYATVQSYNSDPANVQRVIIKTMDGGASWQELPLVTAPGIQQFGIGFADEQRGWVGCVNGGYETMDGGENWSPVAMGRAVNKIRIVRDSSGARAFAIGVDVHRLEL